MVTQVYDYSYVTLFFFATKTQGIPLLVLLVFCSSDAPICSVNIHIATLACIPLCLILSLLLSHTAGVIHLIGKPRYTLCYRLVVHVTCESVENL
ncbi:hypothetical protein M405DRAFT_174471 [Rhizopogon salebrosus TDB-379]|nr:hypothetical protein M405DRAFT_174471 [Rhizopogon salebrosus TDB-379]